MINSEEQFLITHNLETDETLIRRCKNVEHGRWATFGKVEPGELPLAECDIGAEVLMRTPGGYKHGAIYLHRHEGGEPDSILIPLEPIEPVGVDYLKTLTVGKTYKRDGMVSFGVMVTSKGLAWADGESWTWDGKDTLRHGGFTDWRNEVWVQAASPETIIPWVAAESG